MDELEVVVSAGVVSSNSGDLLLGAVHAFGEGDDLFLVFPEQDEGEWDENGAYQETTDAVWIAILLLL